MDFFLFIIWMYSGTSPLKGSWISVLLLKNNTPMGECLRKVFMGRRGSPMWHLIDLPPSRSEKLQQLSSEGEDGGSVTKVPFQLSPRGTRRLGAQAADGQQHDGANAT
jgi:hypothetical protein